MCAPAAETLPPPRHDRVAAVAMLLLLYGLMWESE